MSPGTPQMLLATAGATLSPSNIVNNFRRADCPQRPLERRTPYGHGAAAPSSVPTQAHDDAHRTLATRWPRLRAAPMGEEVPYWPVVLVGLWAVPVIVVTDRALLFTLRMVQ